MAEGWRDLLGQVLAVRGSYPDWINEMQGTCTALERKNAIAVEALKRLRDNAHHLGGACEWVDEVTVGALDAMGEAG